MCSKRTSEVITRKNNNNKRRRAPLLPKPVFSDFVRDMWNLFYDGMLILACATTIISSDDVSNWEFNFQQSSNFKCKHPQPRAVKAVTIIKETILDFNLTTEILHPGMTVLHRCDEQSGCCLDSEQSCSPSTTSLVQITFKVFGNHSLGKKSPYITVEATNHTSCSCTWNQNSIK